jgi:nucleoside-diphosphate-sugar epimerase
MNKIGIIGYRSWISIFLADEMHWNKKDQIVYIEKDGVNADADFSYLKCVYLFAGNSRPNEKEMKAELDLIERSVKHIKHKNVIYISSQSAFDETPYGKHKGECESIIISNLPLTRNWQIIRPPAVFGLVGRPFGQDINSTMLIPSLIRDGGLTELKEPNKLTKFIHVKDLIKHLLNLQNSREEDVLVYDNIPGTFELTPQQLKDLYYTFTSYIK